MSERPIPADFPYRANYVEVRGSRMHFVDEGPADADPIVFLHGNPTWSYIWRNIIPPLASRARCIAPDLIGMGRSDKPDIDYRFFDHAAYVDGFLEALGLRDITLVMHDWGSALGFHHASRNEANIKGLAFMEAALAPAPSWDAFPPETASLLRAFRTPELGRKLIVEENVFIEQVLPAGVVRPLGDAEMAAYREPFPDAASRTPVWRWPNEIPIAGEPPDVVAAVAAYNAWLQWTELPKLLFHATPGAIVPEPLVAWCRRSLPRLDTVDLGEGRHYLQEDHPEAIGTALAAWYATL